MRRDQFDFLVGLPKIKKHLESIWMIMDRMTKSTHFLLVKITFSAKDYAKLYIWELIRMHGVPLSIVSDSGSQFISYFWKLFQRDLGNKVKLSTAFHHQIDGQAE